MEKHLFLGDEAIAQAAIDAGISGVYAYPGTPSTEITEFIQHPPLAREKGIHSRWNTNEKNSFGNSLRHELCRKKSTLLYEACGPKCGC